MCVWLSHINDHHSKLETYMSSLSAAAKMSVPVSCVVAAAAAVCIPWWIMHKRRSARLPKLSFLDVKLAVVRLPSGVKLEDAGFSPDKGIHASAKFFSVTRTVDETSIVVDERLAPPGPIPSKRIGSCSSWRPRFFIDWNSLAYCQRSWAQKISIFAISTYDTDYVLLKQEKREAAIAVLSRAGYVFV